jgi:RNA 2',3'-cyclic 3'-phosphodiesterase
MTDAAATTEPAESIRSFVAVPLPPEMQARIMEAARELAREPQLQGVRWSRKVENLHVTIKFLGAVAEAELTEFGSRLQTALASMAPFRLGIAGIGAFPSLGRANILWAGVHDETGDLERIATIVEGIAAQVGVGEPAARRFQAHVTVGRAKTPVDASAPLERVATRRFGVAYVHTIHVYESQLGGGPDHRGSTYVVRHRAALALPKDSN